MLIWVRVLRQGLEGGCYVRASKDQPCLKNVKCAVEMPGRVAVKSRVSTLVSVLHTSGLPETASTSGLSMIVARLAKRELRLSLFVIGHECILSYS